MESQIQPHRVQLHEHDPHNLGLLHQSEEDGQHHEKKSVLKKVKAKAKKIKDTITKHGHDHDQDHDQDHDHDHDHDRDDELVEDPELHGAPMYESAAMRSGMAGQMENPNVGLGRSTAITHDQSSAPKECVAKPIDHPSKRGQHEQSKVNLRGPMSMEVDPHAPKEADHAPRNYEIKTIDLAGRGNKEVGYSKIIDSFGKMKVNEEPQTNQKTTNISSTGSHDQFSPEPNPEQNLATIPETENQPPEDESSYTQKMSAVASKFGYGDQTKSALSAPLEYGKKLAATVTEKLSPVYEKVTGTGTETETMGKGVGVKEYWMEKLKPGEEDRALSEMISGALHKPKGKVEESQKVERRLDERGKGSNETEKGVESRMKDTVGSWLGKTGDSQTSQQSLGSSQQQGVEGFKDSSSSSVGEATQGQDPGSGSTQAEVRIL